MTERSKDYASGSPDDHFGCPANYRILVRGALRPNWSKRLGGFSISATTLDEGFSGVTLEGQVKDQAELHGLLEALHGLHLSILRVEKLQ